MIKIPLFNLDFDEKEAEAVLDVLRSGWLTMGEVTMAFERQFSEYMNVKHAIAVSSCTAALHLANLVLGIGSGDEVICPSLSFVAGANSIEYVGARPVFADITSENDLCICPKDIKKRISGKTKAIQVMHYGGYPCQMDVIDEMAKKYSLHIIEDCAHAPGAKYLEKNLGTFGIIGCFSFFSNKNMTTAEGGMLVTNNDEIAEKLRKLRCHGMTSMTYDRKEGKLLSYDVVDIGYNYRMDEIRSAIGIVQLNKLSEYRLKRKRFVSLYCNKLKEFPYIRIPFEKKDGISAYHLFPILLHEGYDRDAFMKFLVRKGIQTSIHYKPIHTTQYYSNKYGLNLNLGVTENVADRLVTLPLYPAMTDNDIEFVVKIMSEFFI